MAVRIEEDKRKTIVNEIEGWRRSKLLPEQYCDFLQNLYLDDLNDRPKGLATEAVRRIGQASPKQWILVFGIFALICVVVLHFSVFPLALQIGLIGALTTGLIGLGGKWLEAFPLKGSLVLVIGMLFFAGSGFALLRLHGWTSGAGPIVLLATCGALWIGCGLALRFSLMHVFGWIALIGLYGSLLSRYAPDPGIVEAQAYWLPAALLFAWLSWFSHIRIRSAGIVLFATALVLWFMPELYSSLLGASPSTVQAAFAVKVVLLGFALYRLKKRWMEWVV